MTMWNIYVNGEMRFRDVENVRVYDVRNEHRNCEALYVYPQLLSAAFRRFRM
jgi:hypothetical protein